MAPGDARGSDEIVAGAGDEPSGTPRLLWAVGLVLAAVVLATARPDLYLLAARDATPAEPSPTAADDGRREGGATVGARHRLDGIHWQPRGDLVADGPFAAAAMGRIRAERPEVSRLFFAGRLPDGSRLVLAGTDVNRGVVATRVHALLVPSSGPIGALPVTEATALTDPAQVLAWAARGNNGHVYALAMTRPGPVRFELSARVQFSGTGTARRLWTSFSAPDGVVVADLGRRADPIVSVRADGPGVFVLPLVVRVVPRSPRPAVLPVDGVGAPEYAGPDAVQVSRALTEQAGAVLDLAGAAREVIWSGTPWKQRRLALVLLRRQDGQRFHALVGQQGDTGFPLGVRALPDTAPDRLPWLFEPLGNDEPTLLLCPTGPGRLLYSRSGQPSRTLPVDANGVVVLVPPGPTAPSVSGAEVMLLDGQGRLVLRTVLPAPGFEDPLDLD